MKFRHLQIFRVYGISLPLEDGEIFFLQDEKLNIKAISSTNIDNHCFEIDRRNAIGRLVLSGPWGEKDKDKVPQAIEENIKRIRDVRKKNIRSGTPIVLQLEGEIENLKDSVEREFDDFTICLGQIYDYDREKISSNSLYAKNILSVSLSLAADNPIEIKKIDSGMYLYDNEKIYYPFEISINARSIFSQNFNEELAKKTNNYFNVIKKLNSLDKVFRLLAQAIDNNNDNLRRFIFSWTALEMLINKIFNGYEKEFLGFLTNLSPGLPKPLIDRIAEVMNDKYRLQDKFIIIVSFFRHENSGEILKEFIKIKKIRDQVFHGEDIKEDILPTENVIKIINNCLRKHIER